MSITQLIKKPFVFFAITMAYSFAFPGITKAANPISKLYLNELNENYKPNRSQPDSSYQKASELFILYSSQKDTTLATICLLELSDIERYQGKYEEAFEYLWKAAELFEAKLKDPLNIRINRTFGILFNIYNKDELTLRFQEKALQQAKKFVEQQKADTMEIAHCYFALSFFYRNKEDFPTALQYLDSCKLLYNNKKLLAYVEADKGLIYLKTNQINLATKHLYKIKDFFLDGFDPYQVVYLSYLGDLKSKTNQPDSAIFYYSKSLQTLEKRKVFLDYKPSILESLALLYSAKKEHEKAFELIYQSKRSMDSLFNVTNSRNNKLFKISTDYKEQLLENEGIIEKQNETISKKERTQLFLTISVITIIVISLLTFIFVQQKNKLKKLRFQKDFEKEKHETVIKVKSKELTACTLQIIEKDQVIKDLLEIIGEMDKSKSKTLEKKHLIQSKNLWDSFNKRFLELNNEFFTALKEKHDNLSGSEQKLCSLIRLKLDNNEIAQILNISLHGVHTSRYRLRKKINLSKTDSLDDYITSI